MMLEIVSFALGNFSVEKPGLVRGVGTVNGNSEAWLLQSCGKACFIVHYSKRQSTTFHLGSTGA